jgi:hypothetical protein
VASEIAQTLTWRLVWAGLKIKAAKPTACYCIA